MHPDKNSHPGATEAFKRLKDAYERLTNGEPGTASVLAIGQPTAGRKPPRVISVKIHK